MFVCGYDKYMLIVTLGSPMTFSFAYFRRLNIIVELEDYVKEVVIIPFNDLTIQIPVYIIVCVLLREVQV